MMFIATAVDFEIKSFGLQLEWPVVGVAVVAAVASWLVFLLIRKE